MIAKKLKELREKKGMSQAELANILDVAQQTVASWEREKSSPNYELLLKLADFFRVSTDYLLGKEDSPMESMKRILLAPSDGKPNLTKEMLDDYASLSADGKEKARSYIKYLAREDAEARVKKDYGKSTTA